MSTPLTSPAITAFESERAAKALWLEWLTQWFDGNTKTIGLATDVEMPRLASDDIHFDAGAARQPLMDRSNAQELRIIHTPLRTRVHDTSSPANALEGRWVFDHVAITFWLASRFASMEESNLKADITAQRLHALLLHPDPLQMLAVKGIHHVHPQRPSPIQAPGIALRMLRVQAQYHYIMPFSG